MSTATVHWQQLDRPFQIAIEQAWFSWGQGNFGIGAALIDPATDEVIAVGRNLVASGSTPDQPLGGNYLAHAEMNAFASMPTYSARGLHLYSTLEPCLMCAATAIFLNVAYVRYAAADEYFENLDGLWQHHPYTSQRKPQSELAVAGKVSAFCRLLPMEYRERTAATSVPAEAARVAEPALAELAVSPKAIELRNMAIAGEPVIDGLEFIWPELTRD